MLIRNVCPLNNVNISIDKNYYNVIIYYNRYLHALIVRTEGGSVTNEMSTR